MDLFWEGCKAAVSLSRVLGRRWRAEEVNWWLQVVSAGILARSFGLWLSGCKKVSGRDTWGRQEARHWCSVTTSNRSDWELQGVPQSMAMMVTWIHGCGNGLAIIRVAPMQSKASAPIWGGTQANMEHHWNFQKMARKDLPEMWLWRKEVRELSRKILRIRGFLAGGKASTKSLR